MINILPFSKSKINPVSESVKPIGFEPEDKPTPLAGKILLLIMAILLIFLGMQGLSDVEDIPKKPERISFCAAKIYYYSNEAECNFSKYEVSHGVPALYQDARNILSQKDQLERQRNNLSTQLASLNQTLRERQRQYDLSLQETIADQSRVGLTPEQLRIQIQSYEQQINSLNQNLTKVNNEITNTQARLDLVNDELEIASKKAQADFKKDNAVYRFWVFLIQAILVFPLFFIFLRLYLKLKAKDSPHTIIATTLLGVSGLFILYITIRYLWKFFLADLLEILAKYLADLPIFRTLLFYVGMLLVIAIFGGAVYFLQKKIFDPTRVQLRRLRAHKCPYCEFPFNFSKEFCPSCGKQLMDKCSKCNQDRYTVMMHCPHCGTKRA